MHASSRSGSAKLVISDNGKGIGEAAGDGAGLRLIRALADQLRGDLTQSSSSGGTTTTLSFIARAR